MQYGHRTVETLRKVFEETTAIPRMQQMLNQLEIMLVNQLLYSSKNHPNGILLRILLQGWYLVPLTLGNLSATFSCQGL